MSARSGIADVSRSAILTPGLIVLRRVGPPRLPPYDFDQFHHGGGKIEDHVGHHENRKAAAAPAENATPRQAVPPLRPRIGWGVRLGLSPRNALHWCAWRR